MPQNGRNTICAPSSAAGMLQSFLYSTMNRVPHLAVTIGRPTKRVYSYSYRKATMGSTRIARRAGMEDPREERNLGGGHTWRQRAPGGFCVLCGCLAGWRFHFLLEA